MGATPDAQTTSGRPATAGSSVAGTSSTATGTAGSTIGALGTPASGAAGAASAAGGTGEAGGPGGAAAGGTSAAGQTGAASGTGGAGSVAGSSGAAAGSTAAGRSAAGAAGVAGTAGAISETMDLLKGDGSDVITIGDSWMNIGTNGGGIEGGLDRAMTKYRHYAVAGTLLLNGDIPGQYDRAKKANPKIATIIMTGGGNDVMFSGGCNTKESCTMFSQKIADGLDALWTKAAADGVTTTVYIQYSKNAGTAPSDTRPDMAPVPKICTMGKLKCITIGTTDLVAASDTVDGIHPTKPACDLIAKRVLDEMAKAGARR